MKTIVNCWPEDSFYFRRSELGIRGHQPEFTESGAFSTCLRTCATWLSSMLWGCLWGCLCKSFCASILCIFQGSSPRTLQWKDPSKPTSSGPIGGLAAFSKSWESTSIDRNYLRIPGALRPPNPQRTWSKCFHPVSLIPRGWFGWFAEAWLPQDRFWCSSGWAAEGFAVMWFLHVSPNICTCFRQCTCGAFELRVSQVVRCQSHTLFTLKQTRHCLFPFFSSVVQDLVTRDLKWILIRCDI